MSTFTNNELANLYKNLMNSQGSQESAPSSEERLSPLAPAAAAAAAAPKPVAPPVANDNVENNENQNNSLNALMRGMVPAAKASVPHEKGEAVREASQDGEAEEENNNSLNAILRGNVPANVQGKKPFEQAEVEAEVKEEPEANNNSLEALIQGAVPSPPPKEEDWDEHDIDALAEEDDQEEEDSLEAILQGDVAPLQVEEDQEEDDQEEEDSLEAILQGDDVPLQVEEDAEEDQEEEEDILQEDVALLEEEAEEDQAEEDSLEAILQGDVAPLQEERDERKEEFGSLTDPELLDEWDSVTDFAIRDRILLELQRRNLFPSPYIDYWEGQTGAYPDIMDPMFLQKLLAKREFAESLQTTWEPSGNPCEKQSTFEVTPVQRFVANFMSPKTPYMSALLFHGVGVGKTCAAVQIAEAWLEAFPNQPVYLVAPRTIQQGFLRTIFDISSVTIGKGNEPNTANQCTGITYMKLSNTLYERDPERIQKQVNKLIRRRYDIYGYQSFANSIEARFKGISADLPPLRQNLEKKKKIREAFSGRLLIVDEAHNLRDVEERDGESDDVLPGGPVEKDDVASGKRLTPFLKQVLQYSEGLKFCALTATPMYNTYKEIIFILNLLLMNDKKATITARDVFDPTGAITERGRNMLIYIAQRYISFMRGENPISFPVRLFPEGGLPRLPTYPSLNPSGVPIPEQETRYYSKLPIVPIPLKGEALRATEVFMRDLAASERLGPFALEKLVHAGNFVVPVGEGVGEGEEEMGTIESYKRRTDKNALQLVFQRDMVGGQIQYRAKREGGADWLRADQIGPYSPKMEFLLNRVQHAEGCIFVYTRFVNAGAIPLALALEANGYTAFGREPLLHNGARLAERTGGRQCALCPKREQGHEGESHPFTPAHYGILTGEESVSPDNAATIAAQRRSSNKNGVQMKIIIGSQIASEGVDLRFVRETHVLDSWFHLNKTEQILGRAIRYLSHCELPEEKRNNTVYLYVAALPAELQRETADMYSYRFGFNKALLIGHVTRTIKQAAMDWNLNHDAITIRDQAPIRQVDSQRRVRDHVNINDMPFTAVCDWIETCEYKCIPSLNVPTVNQPNRGLPMDDSTYDEYSARWRVHKMKERLRTLFSHQPFFSSEDMWNSFSDVPRLVTVDLLSEVVDNKNFQLKHNDLKGYIRYCNGYYLFQPNVYADLTIPIAIRTASFPVKRDVYAPDVLAEPVEEDEKGGVEEAEEKQAEVDVRATHRFWEFIEEWTRRLVRVVNFGEIPAELQQRMTDMAQGDKKIQEVRKEYIDAVRWFHDSFHKSAQKDGEAYRRILLQYFWDEWLTMEEQKYLFFSSGLHVEDCIRDSQYRVGKVVATRFVDPSTGETEYYCEGGDKCVEAIVGAIKDSEKIPFTKRDVGAIFGFLAPKRGPFFVFKTDDLKENKPIRGQECANSTNRPPKIKALLTLGSILQEAGRSDFDLSDKGFTNRPIRGPGILCTLMDLVIRFLHVSEVQKKQWFFRPVKTQVLVAQMKKPPKRK